MSRFTNLCKLSMFMVKRSNSSRLQYDELEGLKTLKKLRGAIEIMIKCPVSDAFVKNHVVTEGGYIRDKEHLRSIMFTFKREDGDEEAINYEEELLEALQPHSNLKVLEFDTYCGVRMPRWADGDNLAVFLPNLAYLELSSCLELQSLSSLAKLRFLESLRLHDLPNLEYIESYSAKDMMLGSSVEGLQIFPRLVFIALYSLPKLKGWFTPLGETVSDDNQISSNKESQHSSLLFPVFKYLVITNCPELTSFPNCPKLTDLTLCLFNERLRMTETPTSPKLEQVTIDNLTGLQHLLPIQSFQSLTLLTLRFNSEVESLNDFRQVLCDCFSSLQTIEISLCSKIRTVFGGLSYLDSLNSLTLGNLPVLNLANEEIDENNEDESVGLGSLCHTLRHLHISYCGALVTFPKWMRKLTSLQQLKVMGCSPVLKERCQNPTGEDWPNIRHILSVSITERKYNNLT